MISWEKEKRGSFNQEQINILGKLYLHSQLDRLNFPPLEFLSSTPVQLFIKNKIPGIKRRALPRSAIAPLAVER